MDTQEDPLIQIKGIWKSFGTLQVLQGIDLRIQPGQATVIIGPSGCGKTVLLKHMIALLRPDRGEVWYRDKKISSMSERKLYDVRKRYGFVFQGGALFDSMTVEQNVCFPMREHSTGSTEEQKEQCCRVLSMVGLEGLQDRLPVELSGGQKKRVALARAIALDPELILYDEPTTGLDPIRSDLINELILRMQDELGSTNVVVTHDMASARKVGDRIIMLHEGKIVADTTPEKIDQLDNEIVSRFVEGRASDEELEKIQADQGDTEARADAARMESQK
jgi:phospholipid/cholesterol/gamma-HCH transport system ATP-binding protein